MLPSRVDAALSRATHAGFELSCDPAVGQLLAVLAAAVPRNGRILELGTGCGVGLAWITHGLEGRADVEVVTIESAPEAIAVARSGDWPSFVSIVEGDAVTVLPTVGEFDLVFADAEGGKWERLDLTLAAVRLHGVLIVDDMTTGALGERAASLQDSRGEGSPAVRCPVRERRDHAGRGRDRVDADSFVELATQRDPSRTPASHGTLARAAAIASASDRNSRPE